MVGKLANHNQSDLLGHYDDKPEKSRDSRKKKAGLHFDTLFDQNEDESGEKIDLATGKPIDNSTFKYEAALQEAENGHVVSPHGSSNDVMSKMPKDSDLADQ